jgi:hypothetical protein
MWKCRLCKAGLAILIAVILALVIKAILSGGALAAVVAKLGVTVKAGADGFQAWQAFIIWLGAKIGYEGAIKELGYTVFSAILAAGAASIYFISDIIGWLLCLLCKLVGACDECEKPSILR